MLDDREIIDMFFRLADYLEFLGENRFKVIAYRRAAHSIQETGQSIKQLYESGKLRELPGVGDAIVKKIGEILTTEKMSKLEELRIKIPPPIIEMLNALPISSGKIACLIKNGIGSMQELRKAAENGKLEQIDDFDKTKTKKIKLFFNIP